MTYPIDTTDLVFDFVDGCEFPASVAMTVEQVRERLDKEGKTIKQFAEANDLNYRTVVCVMNGVNKGRRGEAHRAAVALGLK